MLCPRVSSPPTPLHHPGLFLNLISPRRFSRKTALVSSSSSVLPYTWVRGLCLTLSPSTVNSTRARTPSPRHTQQASGTAADQGCRNHHSKAPCKWAGKSTGGLLHPSLALPVSCTPSCQPQHPQALDPHCWEEPPGIPAGLDSSHSTAGPALTSCLPPPTPAINQAQSRPQLPRPGPLGGGASSPPTVGTPRPQHWWLCPPQHHPGACLSPPQNWAFGCICMAVSDQNLIMKLIPASEGSQPPLSPLMFISFLN